MHKAGSAQSKTKYFIILFLTITIAFCCGIFLFTNTLGTSAPADYIHLDESALIDGQVWTRQGEDCTDFTKPYYSISEERAFMQACTEQIVLNYSYSNKPSISVPINHTYTVVASVIIRENATGGSGGSVVNNDRVDYLDNITESSETEYKNTKSYNINLDEYYDYYAEFRSKGENNKLNLSAELQIVFTTSITNGTTINNKYARTVSIPIGSALYAIKTDGDTTKNTDYNAPTRSTIEMAVLFGAGVGIIISLSLALYALRKITNHKSWYRQEIDNLLAQYDDAIINTTTPIKASVHKDRIMIESFKELLNLATDTGNPIMYYEVPSKAIFYILKDEIIYIYYIDKTDTPEEKVAPIREREDEAEREAHREDKNLLAPTNDIIESSARPSRQLPPLQKIGNEIIAKSKLDMPINKVRIKPE